MRAYKLSEKEIKILGIMGEEKWSVISLAEKSGFPVSVIRKQLSTLFYAGYVERLPGMGNGWFYKSTGSTSRLVPNAPPVDTAKMHEFLRVMSQGDEWGLGVLTGFAQLIVGLYAASSALSKGKPVSQEQLDSLKKLADRLLESTGRLHG